jgi:hypothetical protein
MDVDGNALITTQRLIIPTREPYSNVVYVATTGSDTTGTGSMTNPYLTINQALVTNMSLYADLCVHVAAGTYAEDVLIPNFACSVTIIGAAFPNSDYDIGATDQYSTILTGNLGMSAPNTADSQLSLKFLRFNYATSKFMNLVVPSIRGGVFIDSCFFTRQNADEAQTLATFGSSLPVNIRNSTFSRLGTADSLTTLVNFGNNITALEDCIFQGRVNTNGLIQIVGTITIDNCTFSNGATSSTNPAPCILTIGAVTGRQFRCSNSQFYLHRGAIFQNTRTAASPIIFNNCIYTFSNGPLSTGATFMFMNTSGTSCGISLLNVAQFGSIGTSIKRANAYDPVNFTLLPNINQAQSIYMADFNLEEVNSVNGVNNTNLHIEAVGTGHVALRTAGTARVVVNEAGLTTFNTTLPVCSVVPTTGNQLVNKTYVDGAITAAGYIPQIVATGGSVVDFFEGGIKYRCHRFTATGAWTLSVTSVDYNALIDVCMVGGGGAGGVSRTNSAGCGGGGGAGALLMMKNLILDFSVLPYNITGFVGQGGITGSGDNTAATINGITYIAAGGGVGAAYGNNGNNGVLSYTDTTYSPYTDFFTSSGGGGGALAGSGRIGGFGTAAAFPEFDRGDQIHGGGRAGGLGTAASAGGGGGAGAVGNDAEAGPSGTGGNGGVGRLVQFDNTTRRLCGGGGGGGTVTRGIGPLGYNAGSGGQGLEAGTSAGANTGGGGGGGANSGLSGARVGGQGGSGLVMIRYPIG